MNYNDNPFVNYNTLGELPTFNPKIKEFDGGLDKLTAIRNLMAQKLQESGVKVPKSDPIKKLESETVQQTPVEPQQQQTPDKPLTNISDEMFENICGAEGSGNFIAHAETKKFGEKFVTGPYGQVYKRIDEHGNPLKKILPFKEGERVDPVWAKMNAKQQYTERAQEWLKRLAGKPGLTQDRLDALVSTTQGTSKAKEACYKYITEHWGDWDKIVEYIKTHAVTAAGNGKVMPGLKLRRLFEAAWFQGDKKPFKWYQKNRKQFGI